MRITDLPAATPGPAARSSDRRPETPEEAARQFEEVLVRQFVQTMTAGLFESKLQGEDGPGWMGAYGDLQKNALTDTLTKHLVDGGALRLSDLLLRNWNRAAPDEDAIAPGSPATE